MLRNSGGSSSRCRVHVYRRGINVKREPPHTIIHTRRTSSASSPIHNSTTRGRIQPFNSLTNNSRSTGILLFEPDRQVSRTDTQSRHTHVVRRPFHPFASLFILLKLDLFSRDVRFMKREPGSRIVSVKRRIYRSQCGSPRVAVRSFPHMREHTHDAHFNKQGTRRFYGHLLSSRIVGDEKVFNRHVRLCGFVPALGVSSTVNLRLSLFLSLHSHLKDFIGLEPERIGSIDRSFFFSLSLSSLLFDRPFELSRQDPSHATLGEKDSPE